jgi:hypothetical protein
MCTSPIFPPSRVRKAPYGVIRLTVPSMTAPTSRSARAPPRPFSAGSSPAHRRFGQCPIGSFGPSIQGRDRTRVGTKGGPPTGSSAHARQPGDRGWWSGLEGPRRHWETKTVSLIDGTSRKRHLWSIFEAGRRPLSPTQNKQYLRATPDLDLPACVPGCREERCR